MRESIERFKGNVKKINEGETELGTTRHPDLPGVNQRGSALYKRFYGKTP